MAFKNCSGSSCRIAAASSASRIHSRFFLLFFLVTVLDQRRHRTERGEQILDTQYKIEMEMSTKWSAPAVAIVPALIGADLQFTLASATYLT